MRGMAGSAATPAARCRNCLRGSFMASLRLDVGCPDHFGPFLGFAGDELSKVGGRERKQDAAEISETSLQLGVGKTRIDLLVEPANELSGRVPGCAHAVPRARLIARQ